MKSTLNFVGVAVLFLAVACADPQPGEQRGRLGGNGGNGNSGLRTFIPLGSLVPPPNYRPRAQSMRMNLDVAKMQIGRRLQQGEFSKDSLPTLASLREIGGPKKVTLSLPDGRTVKSSTMCLMTAGAVSNGSALSLSEGPCPGDNEAVRNSDIPLTAKELSGRPSTVLYFEIMYNGAAIGRFSSSPSFAKNNDGSYFPNGARRYWLLDLCTTREIPANDPSGLTTVDYERACIDAGLLS